MNTSPTLQPTRPNPDRNQSDAEDMDIEVLTPTRNHTQN
jgi:hypothetical protein